MAKEEIIRDDISIDGNIATWDMRMEGNISGTYTGLFKFKCFLTPTQKITANREYRQLIGQNPTLAGNHESLLAYALTQLKQRVVEAPPFWTSTLQSGEFAGDIPDEEVITAVLDAAIGAEIKYREHLKNKKEEAIKKAKMTAEKMLQEQREEDEGEDKKDSD